jgi:hypothetical protein
MADDRVEGIATGQPIRATWLNRLVTRVNAIPAPRALPPGDQAADTPTGTTTTWTVTDVDTEEVEVEGDSCTVTVTRVTGFTATDGNGNTMIVTGFDV